MSGTQQHKAPDPSKCSLVYSFTQTNIGTNNQLVEKLKDLAEGSSRNVPSGSKGSFSQVKRGREVVECVVCEDYIAYLLREGCVCRVRYHEEQPGNSSETKEKSDDDAASTSSARSRGSRSASPRPEGGEDRGPSSSLGHSWSALLSSIGGSSGPPGGGVSRLASRGRIQLLRRRGSGRGIIARWPVISASEVPDDVIDQAMAVLQGKSRENVIRELQRTNLDVNQAVNNLLSRDDDEGEQEEAIAAFLPSGEELLSLLGGVGDDELEEVLGRVRDEGGAGRESRAALYDMGEPLQSEIRSLVSLAGGRTGGPSTEGGRRRGGGVGGGKEASVAVPVLFDDRAEWWEPKEPDCRFVAIAALYSELLAVDNSGRLHSWAWRSATPQPCHHHGLEQELGLAGERIKLIAGRLLRASIVTESGKLATWLDRSVRAVSGRLEHRAQSVPELTGETVSQLHVCELFSVVLTESGKMFWWGMLPFSDRKQAILQAHERVRLAKYGGLSGGKAVDAVIQGSRVCLRSSPIYSVGTRAIHIQGGKVQCGILQESVFSTSLSEKCRFRVICEGEEEDMEVEKEEEAAARLGSKRKFSDDGCGPIGGERAGKEEFWSLRSVIFTDSLQTLKTGTVVKIDGSYAAVHFPALEAGEVEDASLSNCRLLKKDDLILASEAQAHQTPYFSQESLKRLKLPPCYHPLTLTCDHRGVHVLLSAHSLLRYVQYSMTSGRFVQNAQFSEATSRFFLKQSAPKQLVPVGVALWLVRDANGGLFPFSRDHAGAMRDSPFMVIPPVTCVCVGPRSSDSQVCVVCLPKQALLSAVTRCDLPTIKSCLEEGKDLQSVLSERCAGGSNCLHVLAWLGRPQEQPMGGGGGGVAARTTPRACLRELMKHARAMASGAPPFADPFMWGEEEGEGEGESVVGAGDAVRCVEWLCGFNTVHSILSGLLKERNSEGYTPFMAATAYKAYGVALRLFNLAVMVSDTEETLTAMLYPPDCHPDDNPVFVVCRNDTCSFTWTGEEHIQQDIFECRTCSLTGSLCCCTECAYTCHRGHDCSFKRSSPTAYCDCWEKCKCRSLTATSDSQRLSLLLKLLRETSLGMKMNSRKQHLLGMLVGTLARQTREQGQWQSLRTSASYRQRAAKHEDAPPHDLPPPKFAQKALNQVLEDWRCVKVALMSGEEEGGGRVQPSTVSVDALTHTLLAKLNQETLDSLLTRLVRQVGPSSRNAEAVTVCERFLRSVVRVFTTCQIEAFNVPQSSLSTARRRSVSSTLADRAARVLSSLAPLAVRPLVQMARAIVHPVTVGMARPVDPLCMSDRHKTAEELFKLPPPSLFRTPPFEDEHADDGGSDTESEGEDVGPAHDASSTATIGSNPIYLSSDQDSSDGEEVESGADERSIDGDRLHDDDLLMDHTPSHRLTLTPSSTHWTLPAGHVTSHTTSSRLSRLSTHNTRELCRDYLSMGVSASLLAQTFSLLVRQLVEVFTCLNAHLHPPTPPYTLPTLDDEPGTLRDHMWAELCGVWAWLFAEMDVIECQVRVGNAMEGKVPTQGRSEVASDILESRKDFLAYILSLLRASHHEHGGVLPSLDLSAVEHLAWALDALYFLLKNSDQVPSASDEDREMGHPEVARFFRRSTSTTYLGAVPLSPFAPLSEALPLAEKPHLLDQEHPRPDLFGYEHPTLLEVWPTCPLPDPPVVDLLKAPLPSPWRSGSAADVLQVSRLTGDHVCGIGSCELAAVVLVGRWCNTVRLFARAFGDTVGRVPMSYLAEERMFESLEREFRREMDTLRTSSSHREVVLEVERGRDQVLTAVFAQLNLFCDGRQMCTSSLPPLCVYRVKARFTGEPGEGSGVLRSFFTSFAEAVLSEDPLPRLELSRPRKPPSPGPGFGSKGKLKDKLRAAKNGNQLSRRVSMERYTGDEPLFYQPGKLGFYAPRYAIATPERLNAYRNIGRVIGLCLLNCETLPLPLCRPVLKYLLHKPVSWHDLAFFDPVMYESLRRLIVDARLEGGKEALADQQLFFQVTLAEEEGGGVRELVPGGVTQPVTPNNVYQYVRQYAKLRMVHISQAALQHLRDGVYDVLPQHSLEMLSSESFRLLLSGCPQIDVDILRGITAFDNESRKNLDVLVRFKSWFWSVLERMSQHERQELLYFWTSSPLLPANVDSYQPPPSITIRPPDDQRLPTANTCISRLYVPLYSTKPLLKLRLLTAIKTKTFGFV